MRNALTMTPHTAPSQGWWRQVPPYATGLMLLIMASHFAPDGHDDQRLLQLLGLALGSLWLCWRPTLIALPATTLPRSLLSLFFLIGLVSASLAPSPVQGFGETGMLFLLLLAALAVAGEMQHDYPAAMATLLNIAAVGCGLYLVQLSVAYGMLIAIPLSMSYMDFIAGFSNYRFFNHAQTILLPLLVLWCSRSGATRAQRALSIGITALFWALLFATGGRGTMVGMAAGACAVLLIQRKQGLRYLAYVAATAALGVAFYWLLFYVVPVSLGLPSFMFSTGLIERTVHNPSSSRTHLWQHAWALIVAHPILGAGPMHFAHASDVFLNASHPHTFLLQIASEWGLPALACLCVLIATGTRSLVHCVRQVSRGDQVNIAIGGALIFTGAAILADGQLSGLLVMPVSQTLIALYIGCALGWVRSRRPAAAPATSRSIPLILRGSLAIAMLAVALAVAADLPALLKAKSGPVTVDSTFLYKPRLWKDGRF